MHRLILWPWLVWVACHFTRLVQPAEPQLRTAIGGLPFNQFEDLRKPCDESCTKYGNCNLELGTCECPFGYTGPSCQTPLFPACRTTTTPGVPIFSGMTIPRNCYCYRQLLRHYCLPGDNTRCSLHTLALWGALRCFEYVDLPEEQQLSDLPEKLDAPGVRWRRGSYFRNTSGDGREYRDLELMTNVPPAEELHDARPLAQCPNRCNERGVCKGGHCVCLAGFEGSDCGEEAMSSLCPNSCGGRGKCIGGFCKCEPPSWGIGCSRQKAYTVVKDGTSHPYYPSLKIYMYDIPMEATGPQPFDDGSPDVFNIFQAFMAFMDMFLQDTSGVRTENPYEANMFYLPAFAFYAGCNLGDPTGAVVRAVDWAAANFPFFNRSAGRDHFVILTADRGACYLKPTPQTENLIRLVHFGMEKPNITDMGALVENKEYGCFKGGRDVVLAPFYQGFKGRDVQEFYHNLAQPGGAEQLLAKKKTLFFFSGDIRNREKEYSGGVRQELAKILANPAANPDVVFLGGLYLLGPAHYAAKLDASKFCLAPYGHGWGIRLTHALLHACVPVIIQDKVRQPWEDLLHYPDFSVRLSKADLPRIVEILRAIPDEDVLRMIKESIRVYRAFIWQPQFGGLAYNYTLASLKRRLSHVRGNLYEAGTRRRRRWLQ